MHINKILKGTSNIIAGNKTIINMQGNIKKVHIENNTANDISKKLFNQITQVIISIHLLTLINIKQHIKNYLIVYLVN